MTVKEEEAVVQAFIKMWKDLTKTGDKLNASQMDAAQKMMKHATDMVSNTKTQKTSLTIENKKIKLGEHELVVREKLKAADEHLVKLRHTLNIEQEREHGDQVRRNINLRHNMDSFNDKFDMLKKSLGGGFGFQAAMDKTVKNMGGMTRTFQENKIAGEQYVDAQKRSKEALKKMGIAFLTGDKADQQEAKGELDAAKKAELRSELNVKNTTKIAERSGVAGRFKPMFAKLDKMGEFLGKKAVPIGLGMGVAGVLMSVIVKSFSASPLFAAMMKMMQFMVRLILMPIGTFFGALLRPILIMLLRKFIIPFYSQAMPAWMALGTQIGEWITTWSWENFVEAIKSINPLYKKDGGSDRPDGGIVQPDGTIKLPNGDVIKDGKVYKNAGDDEPNDGTILTLDPVTGEVIPENSAQPPTNDQDFKPPPGSTPYEHEVDIIEREEAEQSKQWWDTNIWNPLEEFGNWLDSFVPRVYGATPGDGEEPIPEPIPEPDKHTWGDGEGLPEYVNPITPGEGEELSATQKDTDLMMSNPALWQQQINMKNQVETGGIIEDALEPIAVLTENPRFIGTPSEGKLSSIHNAGISEGAYEEANAPSGHGISDAGRALLEAAGMTGGIITAADGFNGMVNSPTMFMAGEAGAEHVTVTPSGGSNGSGGITVNIQNMNGSDNDLRKLKQTILEVIQQSSANRGRL